MTKTRQNQANLRCSPFLPWKQQGVDDKLPDPGEGDVFQARYKRRYILMMILIVIGLVGVGVSLIDSDKSEMFFAVAPILAVPLLTRVSGKVAMVLFIMLISGMIYVAFALPDLADWLGRLTVIALFFMFMPVFGLLWIVQLFDARPQLLIGPDGICSRQHGEDLIPWEDITFIHVSTYERMWIIKVRNLVIGLRRFSSYPEPRSLWTPQYILYKASELSKKPDDPASLHISGLVLDPPLPFVMNAIKHHRPKPKPKPRRVRGKRR